MLSQLLESACTPWIVALSPSGIASPPHSPQLGKVLQIEESESEVAQSCPTLCDVDCSLPGSSVHGIFQARYWSGLPFPSPGDLPNPGIEPGSPALQTDALPSEPPWKPNLCNSKGPRPWIMPSHLRSGTTSARSFVLFKGT